MKWEEIKNEILSELNSPERNLANPMIRTKALEKIEDLLKEVILANPQLLNKIGKETFLKGLLKLKKLNSAEKSIVNHIFDVLEGSPILILKN